MSLYIKKSVGGRGSLPLSVDLIGTLNIKFKQVFNVPKLTIYTSNLCQYSTPFIEKFYFYEFVFDLGQYK